MCSRFELKRLERLLGPMSSGSTQPSSSTDLTEHSRNPAPAKKANFPCPYTYLNLKRGNLPTAKSECFACYRDVLCFSKPPVLKESTEDYDIDSDS